MNMYDKIYDEIYAVVAIHTANPNSIDRIIKGEHPDWQDEEGNLGLEVVRAMTRHMGYVRKIWNEYHGCDIKSIPLRLRRGFLGDFITQKGYLTGISDSKGLVDGTRHIELSIHAAETKLALLNKTHFRFYRENELFIYVPFTINNSDLQLFCNAYKLLQDGFEKKFSRVFLFDNSCLDTIQANGMVEKTYQYSNEQLRHMKQITFALKDSSWEENNHFIENYVACEGIIETDKE